MESENTVEVIFDKNANNDEDNDLTHNEIWDDSLLIQHYDETMNRARKILAHKLTSVSSMADSECSNSHRTELVNGYSHAKGPHSAANTKKKKKKKGRKKNEWHTGDPCRAPYSEDGEIYEATIIGINNARGTCTVRYLGYNNHEEVTQSSLLKSKGEGARRKQVKDVAETHGQSDDSSDESCGMASEGESENERSKFSENCPNNAAPSMGPGIPGSASSQYEYSVPYVPDLPPPPALGLVDGPDQISSEALHTMLMSWYMTGYHTGYYQGLNHGRSFSQKKTKCSSNAGRKSKKN